MLATGSDLPRAVGEVVVAGASVDDVVALGAVDGVTTVLAVDDVVVPVGVDDVVTGPAPDLVVALVSADGVVAVLAVDEVVPRAGVEGVVAGLAVKDVVALVAVEQVAAGAAPEDVVALLAAQHVVAAVAVEGVVVGVARELVVAALALDGVVAGPAADPVGPAVADQQVGGRGRLRGRLRPGLAGDGTRTARGDVAGGRRSGAGQCDREAGEQGGGTEDEMLHGLPGASEAGLRRPAARLAPVPSTPHVGTGSEIVRGRRTPCRRGRRPPRPSGRGDGEALAAVLRLLDLVDQRDGVVLGADEVAGRGVDRGGVGAGALARCDDRCRAEEGPVEGLRGGAEQVEGGGTGGGLGRGTPRGKPSESSRRVPSGVSSDPAPPTNSTRASPAWSIRVETAASQGSCDSPVRLGPVAETTTSW